MTAVLWSSCGVVDPRQKNIKVYEVQYFRLGKKKLVAVVKPVTSQRDGLCHCVGAFCVEFMYFFQVLVYPHSSMTCG